MPKPPHAESFQILDADGGWLTAEGVAVAGDGLNPESVDRSMYRWQLLGFVESRTVGLGKRPSDPTGEVRWRGRQVQTRVEWRVL